MEENKTDPESFIEKIREILDSDLDVNDPVQFQMILDAISIAAAVAKIAAPIDFYEENDGSGHLYWKVFDSSLNCVSVYIKKHSMFDLSARLDDNYLNYENIPFGAVVPLLAPALGKLYALKQEASG